MLVHKILATTMLLVFIVLHEYVQYKVRDSETWKL